MLEGVELLALNPNERVHEVKERREKHVLILYLFELIGLDLDLMHASLVVYRLKECILLSALGVCNQTPLQDIVDDGLVRRRELVLVLLDLCIDLLETGLEHVVAGGFRLLSKVHQGHVVTELLHRVVVQVASLVKLVRRQVDLLRLVLETLQLDLELLHSNLLQEQ